MLRGEVVIGWILNCLLGVFLILAQSNYAIANEQPMVGTIGVGAHPLSFMHASTWFFNQDDGGRKVLKLMVYLEGTPTWHDKTTQFDWVTHLDPATLNFKVDSLNFKILYFRSKEEVGILGVQFKLSENNVFLVNDIDGTKPRVKSLGVYDLSFASEENPSINLLIRESTIREELVGYSNSDSLFPITKSKSKSGEENSLKKEGIRLLKSGQPDDAKKVCDIFQANSDNSNPIFYYLLGYCYQSGRGRPKNLTTANHWYEKAADLGHVDAQYKLGHSYRTARGVKTDFVQAVKWYKKAAENDDTDAMLNLGLLYAAGMGTKMDNWKAYSWLIKSAERGIPAAQFEVARSYLDGTGVEKSLISSYEWLLVLEAQKKSLAPEFFKQVQEKLQSLEVSLNNEKKLQAKVNAIERMRQLSKTYVLRLGKK